ncbi:MAG: sulfotransferase family protein [Acidimicrobiales bacterium]
MELGVVGAGYGRMGTLSFKLALEHLGLGPCYHQLEAWTRPEHRRTWTRAVDGDDVDWRRLFADFGATSDWPACSFWRPIKAAHPGARVVLLRRDPDAWYTSISRTILEMLDQAPDGPDGQDGQERATWQATMRNLIIGQDFGGRTDRAGAIAALRAYEDDVVSSVSTEELLVYEVAQGWEPLCAFLEVEVPDAAFPRTNSTREFRSMFGLERPHQDVSLKGKGE